MKKILYFASMMLAVFTVYSCTSLEDNPAPKNIPVTIEDANGNKFETFAIATFTGEVGSEVSLTLGVYDPYDIYGVDFGDGKIVVDTVCYQNGGLKDENGMTVEWRKSATTFTGTVAGNGTITVYGNSDLWYLIAAGGAIPTSFDFDKLKKVVQMRFSGASVDAIDLNGLEELEQFAFSQGSLGSLKCAGAPKLKDITVNNNTASKFESVLQSIDVSQNPALESLNLMAASAEKSGLLTSLDLSKNPKLSKLYAQYNKISEIKLPAGAVITFMNLQNNQLESIDLSGIASLKDTYLNNNKLKTVDLSKLAAGANLARGNMVSRTRIPVCRGTTGWYFSATGLAERTGHLCIIVTSCPSMTATVSSTVNEPDMIFSTFPLRLLPRVSRLSLKLPYSPSLPAMLFWKQTRTIRLKTVRLRSLPTSMTSLLK